MFLLANDTNSARLNVSKQFDMSDSLRNAVGIPSLINVFAPQSNFPPPKAKSYCFFPNPIILITNQRPVSFGMFRCGRKKILMG